MRNLKYFLEKNRIIIIITVIILICAISIAVGVHTQIANEAKTNSKNEEQNNYHKQLEENFNNIFTNNIIKGQTAREDINYDDIIYCAYDINEENNNYNIDVTIPMFKLENDATKAINKEIREKFIKKIVNIVKNTTERNTFNVDYIVYVNENVLSLVIRCKHKEGSNPQKEIIKTYNYSLVDNKILNIDELIEYKKLNKTDVQNKIFDEIKEKNTSNKTISDQGYNIFIRNEEDDMYKIENTPSFFLGENNYLYLVYAYGEKNYTSEVDLVIF